MGIKKIRMNLLFALGILFFVACSSGSSSSSGGGSSKVLNLNGSWDYAGNLTASDGNVEAHIGACTVTQNDSTASFVCNGTWSSSKTGNQGSESFTLTATVSSSGVTLIDAEISCNNGTGTCICTRSGSGTGSETALNIDITVVSKTCNNSFTATSKFTFTKK